MHEYRIHTLVDITKNGELKKQFPFKTDSGDVIHDKATLSVARNQNSNFDTMIQLLQMRGNIVWENAPKKMEFENLANHAFGSFYEGKQQSWHFQFFVEQSGVYGEENDPVGYLLNDFHNVPIISFCKETTTFPMSAFDTQNHKTINTYFSYSGFTDK